jgi:hypothetical protein
MQKTGAGKSSKTRSCAAVRVQVALLLCCCAAPEKKEESQKEEIESRN